MKTTMNDDDFDVIYSYSEEQAVEDGVLVHPYPDKFPWLLITRSIHEDCVEEASKGDRDYEQVLMPLIIDAIMAIKAGKMKGSGDPIILEHTVAGTVWILPNGKGCPTIMKPEDY